MRPIALALLLTAAPAAVAAATLPVTLNQAVRLTLPAEAHDIIIGNPSIADVTVVDSRHLIVTGKTIGQTNLIVTGGRGQTILSQEVMVPSPLGGRVTLFAGPTPTNYACAPVCVSESDAGGADLAAPAKAAPAVAAPVSR